MTLRKEKMELEVKKIWKTEKFQIKVFIIEISQGFRLLLRVADAHLNVGGKPDWWQVRILLSFKYLKRELEMIFQKFCYKICSKKHNYL